MTHDEIPAFQSLADAIRWARYVEWTRQVKAWFYSGLSKPFPQKPSEAKP